MDLKRKDDWHLHVTLQPRGGSFVQRHYNDHCATLGWQPKVLENVLDGAAAAVFGQYLHELIPTMKLHNEELGRAMILLHDAAKFFAMSGWIVPRIKIEGRVQHADAMYAEAHVLLNDETKSEEWHVPLSRSLTSGKLYATVRSTNAGAQAVNAMRAELLENGAIGAHEEWAVYDSNRLLDGPWMGTWGRRP